MISKHTHKKIISNSFFQSFKIELKTRIIIVNQKYSHLQIYL